MIQEIKAVIDTGVNLRCRYYVNQFPKENDLVVVEVVEVQENASYVELLEYDRIRGMITPNEMTRALRGGMQKALKIGKQQVLFLQNQIVRVLRVDEDQGYIDLSKKKVAKHEEAECKQRYANAKMINSIMRAIAEKCQMNIEDLYKLIVWPLSANKQDIEVFHQFKQALQDQKYVDKLGLDKNIKEKLMDEIERRLKPEPVTIKTEFELQSYDYAGLLVIREALLAGQAKGNEECPLSFQIKASPVYSGQTTTTHKNGIKIMKDALLEIENVMKSYNGTFKIKIEPKIIGDQNNLDYQDIAEDEDEDDEYDNAIIQQNEEDDDDDDDIGMQ